MTMDEDKEDNKDSSKETNTKAKASEDTVIEIEDDVGKATVVQLLKDAICTDDGLYDVSVSKSEASKARPGLMAIDYGVRNHRNIQWVQFTNMAPEPSGIPIPEEDRNPFVRKVFCILTICVAITTVFLLMSMMVPGIRDFFRSPTGVIIGCFGSMLLLPVSYIMCCCPQITRSTPCNWICITMMDTTLDTPTDIWNHGMPWILDFQSVVEYYSSTLLQDESLKVVGYTLVVMLITARYKLVIIVIALIVTTGVVAFCFLLAYSSFDFTSCMLYVFIVGVALMLLSLCLSVATFVLHQKFTLLHLLLCVGFTLYQCFCFIMEIQMVLGGKTVEISTEDHAMGVLMLYSSVITLFLDIIRMLGLIEALADQ